ncbi:hypothetical protein ILYODFUR_009975 [Ilyodon furcidens]|uniref:Uncharacterized protein n=1 Tax=Ilyodon furcidens TaxID=33524 RepID=A0ABV0SNC2_9TELE
MNLNYNELTKITTKKQNREVQRNRQGTSTQNQIQENKESKTPCPHADHDIPSITESHIFRICQDFFTTNYISLTELMSSIPIFFFIFILAAVNSFKKES